MKHRYLAKVYLDEDEIVENTSDTVDQLIDWINKQAESGPGVISGEIIDSKTHHVVKKFKFNYTD